MRKFAIGASAALTLLGSVGAADAQYWRGGWGQGWHGGWGGYEAPAAYYGRRYYVGPRVVYRRPYYPYSGPRRYVGPRYYVGPRVVYRRPYYRRYYRY